MSRQLKLSATLSVLAMALFAALGSHTATQIGGFNAPLAEAKAAMPTLPALGNLLPGLQ